MAQSQVSEVPEEEEREVSFPSTVYPLKAGAIGGALGGAVMALVAIGYGLISGRGIFLPVNVIASTFLLDLRTLNDEQLAQFNLAALIVGTLMHAVLSVGLGTLFALLLPTMPGHPVIWALTIGPLLWVIATVITLPLINPFAAQRIEPVSFVVAHLAYGLVMGMWVAHTPKVPAE